MKTSRIKHILLTIGILCLASTHSTMAQGYDPEEYYTPDVEVINNLIRNNGLQATSNAPKEWKNTRVLDVLGYDMSMIKWDNSMPKRILSVIVRDMKLTGIASFAGLENISYLDCSHNNLTEINLTGCKLLEFLNCANNILTELNLTGLNTISELDCSHNLLSNIDVTNCKLWHLDCSFNKLTELVIQKGLHYPEIEYVICNDNKLTNVTILAPWIRTLNCRNNYLTEISNCDDGQCAGYLLADGQQVSLTLHKNNIGTYSRSIPLISPTFANLAITYENGRLESPNTTINTSEFIISYYWENSVYNKMSGTMNFTYSEDPETGINLLATDKLKIYLNSTNDILIIDSEEVMPITTMVYNMLGSKVLTHASRGSTEININYLPNGAYIAVVVSDGKIIGSTKIIK